MVVNKRRTKSPPPVTDSKGSAPLIFKSIALNKTQTLVTTKIRTDIERPICIRHYSGSKR
jgi:hypothetical protein